MKQTLLTILLLSLAHTGACSVAEPEEAITIYAEEDQVKFKAMLVERGIPFRIEYSNQFRYPVSYRDQIDLVEEAMHAPINNEKKGAKIPSAHAAEILSELAANGIEVEKLSQGEAVTLVWSAELDEAAMTIVKEVLKKHGV